LLNPQYKKAFLEFPAADLTNNSKFWGLLN